MKIACMKLYVVGKKNPRRSAPGACKHLLDWQKNLCLYTQRYSKQLFNSQKINLRKSTRETDCEIRVLKQQKGHLGSLRKDPLSERTKKTSSKESLELFSAMKGA